LFQYNDRAYTRDMTDQPVDYRAVITIEPGKRSGKPCIRGMRITVGDVLGWLAAGMSREEILSDFPDLRDEDITAALAFAADYTSGTWKQSA
jgi:uncharacterized protein (DUF433 family)